MYIIDHCRNAQSERKLACRRTCLYADDAFRLSFHAAGRLQNRAVMDKNFGTGHDDTDRQRRQQTLAAAGLNAGLHLCIQFDVPGGVFYRSDCPCRGIIVHTG